MQNNIGPTVTREQMSQALLGKKVVAVLDDGELDNNHFRLMLSDGSILCMTLDSLTIDEKL